MSRSLWKKALTFWGFLTCVGASAAAPGFVSCGYTLPRGVRVSCDNSVVTISVNMQTWQYRYQGNTPETKIVLDRYLLLTTANSGALTYLFDLLSRKKVVESPLLLIYEDKQRVVFVPDGVSLDSFSHSPEIGIFAKGNQNLKMYAFELRPRPSCGHSQEDLFLPEEEHFIGTAKGFSFVRSDNCGRFVVSYPWPK